MTGGPYVQRRRLPEIRATARDAAEAVTETGRTLQELLDTREKGCCAICGRRSRTKVCARADCATEYERLWKADQRERRYALRGAR